MEHAAHHQDRCPFTNDLHCEILYVVLDILFSLQRRELSLIYRNPNRGSRQKSLHHFRIFRVGKRNLLGENNGVASQDSQIGFHGGISRIIKDHLHGELIVQKSIFIHIHPIHSQVLIGCSISHHHGKDVISVVLKTEPIVASEGLVSISDQNRGSGGIFKQGSQTAQRTLNIGVSLRKIKFPCLFQVLSKAEGLHIEMIPDICITGKFLYKLPYLPAPS